MKTNRDEYLYCFTKAIADLEADPNFSYRYDRMIELLFKVKLRGGRLFIIGMGGSASNAQHMANDFRKIGGIDAISLSDNIAELTARANDDGLETIYSESLKVSNFRNGDALFVLSVSGGNDVKGASMALVNAVKYAAGRGTVMGIVGMPDSVTETYGDCVIRTPPTEKYLTQIAEALQGVIWHGLVSDSRILAKEAKW